MADREKVIKGLEETEIMLKQAVDRGGEMSVMGAFNCLNHVIDTLAMLKENEARLLTQDEIIGYNGYIWKEYKEISTMTVSEIKMGIERVPYNGDYTVKKMNWATYKKLWRCWTEKPTEKQRKAAKWND